jgi:predicted dehydrogenase
MKKPVTVGVIGCGYWGPLLVRNFKSLPDCRLNAVCDVNAQRLKHIGTLYPDIEARRIRSKYSMAQTWTLS